MEFWRSLISAIMTVACDISQPVACGVTTLLTLTSSDCFIVSSRELNADDSHHGHDFVICFYSCTGMWVCELLKVTQTVVYSSVTLEMIQDERTTWLHIADL